MIDVLIAGGGLVGSAVATSIAVIRSSDDRIVLEGNKAFTEE